MLSDITLFRSPGSLYFKLITKKEEIGDLDCDGFLLDMEEKEARRVIESIKQRDKKKLFAFYGEDDEVNRRALETLKINFLVSPENNLGKDTLKQRSSGFNHVLAEIAKKKGVVIVTDLSWLNSLDREDKSAAISRIVQNIKICRKSKVSLKFATFARKESERLDPIQRAAIGFSMGMSSYQAKNCFSFE